MMEAPWHKAIPPAMGFFGAVLMMSYLGAMPVRMWLIALASGPVMAYLATDPAVSYLIATFDWIPRTESALVKLGGLVGCIIGLLSIHLIGAAASTGRRFSETPYDPRDRK